MDRRKLRGRGSLHKNLIGSQLSTRSEPSTENRASQEGSLTRKRKTTSLNLLDDASIDEIGTPLAESTVLKKRRGDTEYSQLERSVCNVITQKTDPSPRKTPQRPKSFTETYGKSHNSHKKSDEINKASTSAQVEKPSPEKKRLSQKPSGSGTRCKLTEFLHKSGITLNTDSPCVLCQDLPVVQQKMKKLLSFGEYTKSEIISLLEKFIENEQNLKNALTDVEISVNGKVPNALHSSSLIRILLQVSQLHPEIYDILFSKLNEAVLIADSMDAVPWTGALLQQFRFLDVVISTDALITNLENLLESCPPWFQTELLLFLPDIVTDKQHQDIAQILDKLMENNPELTSLILNCMSSLSLGKQYLSEYREKVLDLLKLNTKMNAIPAIIKFALEDCTDMHIFKKTLTSLRSTDIQPLVGEKLEDCYKNQLEIITILKMNMLPSKEMVNATVAFLKGITKDPHPLDIILLLLVFSTNATKKKNVETILKQHVKSGFYRSSLLSLFYNDFKQVAQELQPSALQLASNFLKTDERVFVDFAIDWFRLQFLCHKEKIFKQREILERIILLMGNNDQTAKNALTFLCRMVVKEEERQCLEEHCNHLRILLEKMDNFELEEVGILSDFLHNLCMNSSSVSESLRDDLYMLLQKQLSAVKPITKCKGVLGAVMALKHLMIKSDAANDAQTLFETVIVNVKNCPRSQALFYDELAKVIAQTPNIAATFIEYLKNYIEDEFINTYMVDKTSYQGELIPQFGLNNTDEEPENCVLNFENHKYGAVVPISFKLLRTCCIHLSTDGDLEAINALLGCAILMPENLDIAEHSVLDLVICCINWFREVINGFVTQKHDLLRNQVLQRLDNLIHLQIELSTLLSLCDPKYQPSPCYFQHFPTPLFVRIEKKVKAKGKKGRKGSGEKSSTILEAETWELGSTLSSKNPVYFRKLESKIAHLLEVNMELHSSQPVVYNVSLQQVCFVVKELLVLFEQECNETFIRDIIELLPKMCTKLQDVVNSLREDNNAEGREAVRLLLCLLTKVFNWKGFESVTYNTLLRDGLRTLAGQINEANGMLRSCKELVGESYKYFESVSDIATQISLAAALIDMFQALMKHSETYSKKCKEKHAKIAFAFLSLEWPEDKHYAPSYKLAVIKLLNNWIDNEPQPLKTVTTILEWLPEDVSKLEKSQDCLSRIPSVQKNNFHCVYKKLFDGLIKGVKIALPLADSDSERIDVWYEVASNVQKLVYISKTLKTKNNALIFLRYMPILLRIFLNLGMPVLEHNLKYQVEDVTKIVKMLQGGTRYLHAICCDSTEKKDITLAKHVPAAKSVLERLIYSVKGMLVLNNSPAAFWMGNLVNKNLDGLEILSQSLSSEPSTTTSNDMVTDDATNLSSELLDSDSDNDLLVAEDET